MFVIRYDFYMMQFVNGYQRYTLDEKGTAIFEYKLYTWKHRDSKWDLGV